MRLAGRGAHLRLRLVEGVEVLAEGGDNALVPVGVLAEDVLRAELQGQEERDHQKSEQAG